MSFGVQNACTTALPLQYTNDKNSAVYKKNRAPKINTLNIMPSRYTLTKAGAEDSQLANLPTVDLALPHIRPPYCGMIRFRGFFHRTAFCGFLLGIFATFLPSLNICKVLCRRCQLPPRRPWTWIRTASSSLPRRKRAKSRSLQR